MRITKKFLSILVIAAILSSGLAGLAESLVSNTKPAEKAASDTFAFNQGMVYVGTAEEFIAATEADSSACIVLTDSFSLDGCLPSVYFSGTLDG